MFRAHFVRYLNITCDIISDITYDMTDIYDIITLYTMSYLILHMILSQVYMKLHVISYVMSYVRCDITCHKRYHMWHHVWYHVWYWFSRFTRFLGHDVICEMRLKHVISPHILYDIMTQETGKSISHMKSWCISRDKQHDITIMWCTRLISRDKLLWYHHYVIYWLYFCVNLWCHVWCDLVGGGLVLVARAMVLHLHWPAPPALMPWLDW